MNPVVNFIGTRVLAPVGVFMGERVFGWHMADRFPSIPKYMFLAEYHTSNWDLLVLFYAAAKERRRVRFIIKKEVAKWPIVGRLVAWLGAIFIDRDAPLSAIKTIMRTVRNAETCILLICPSGTRAYSEGWQPGFYYLAEKLNLPMVPGAPDFDTRSVLVGEPIMPSGDIEADVALMADFYKDVTPLIPERATPVRLVPAAELDGKTPPMLI